MVRLRNSVMLTFDKQNNWQSVNGYGSTLPQMFLFDQLPPALYQYLQEMESVNGVYGVVRDSRLYRVELKNQSLLYNISDGSITIPANPAQLRSLFRIPD
ncbi:MAG: PepSY-like domain-containing protein [Muribaculaceae bacterium]|nr:PepSY-like domain-containing protein [Muribaculaceae bacterium]